MRIRWILAAIILSGCSEDKPKPPPPIICIECREAARTDTMCGENLYIISRGGAVEVYDLKRGLAGAGIYASKTATCREIQP